MGFGGGVLGRVSDSDRGRTMDPYEGWRACSLASMTKSNPEADCY